MAGLSGRWLGVDVGGPRKRFDVALITGNRLVSLAAGLDREAVAALAATVRPAVVAIDGPRACARPGESARCCERALSRRVCGIRWTPDADAVHRNPYYAWIVEALGLFGALEAHGVETIEVFPTASWTRWFGRRGSASRAGWTRQGLDRLALDDMPRQTNQDQRDAIAAAVTARQHSGGETEAIGEIVVPAGPWPAPAGIPGARLSAP